MNDYICKRGHKNEYRIYNNVYQCNACRRYLYSIKPNNQLKRVQNYRLKNIEQERQKDRDYRINHKDKVQAHKAVAYAIKTKKIIKPLTCSSCASNRSLDGHHYKGYSRENRLNVVWLCRSCHKLLHRK